MPGFPIYACVQKVYTNIHIVRKATGRVTPATTRGATLSAAAALVLLFLFTWPVNNAYRNTRQARAEARFHAGEALAARGQNAAAEEEFRAALTYMHNDPRYRMALARSLIEQGRWGEAESYLSELRRQQDAVTYHQRAIYGDGRRVPRRTARRRASS